MILFFIFIAISTKGLYWVYIGRCQKHFICGSANGVFGHKKIRHLLLFFENGGEFGGGVIAGDVTHTEEYTPGQQAHPGYPSLSRAFEREGQT